MLVDDQSDRRAMLDLALSEVGYVLVACVAVDADLLSAVESCDPDIILIDVEAPGRDTLEGLATVQANVPRPMVMFSQDDNNETIKRATSPGVSAYVVDGLQIKRVRPIIDAAVARFQHFNLLKSELKRARHQLQERKDIERAKGIIMEQRGVTEAVAYQSMRKLAMDTNKKLSDIARSIIQTAALLGK